MARRKEEISQTDFSLGAVRKEAVERDDTSLIEQSVERAQNTISLTTGAIEARPGTAHLSGTNSMTGTGIDLGSGRVFDLHIVPNGVVLYDPDEQVVASFVANPWVSIATKFGSRNFEDIQFWVLPDPDSSSILIGAQDFPAHALTIDDAGVWSFGIFGFSTTLSGTVQQPYWNYYRGVSIQPSARSGVITLTASSPIWTAAHEGLRVRYLEREIVLGTLVSATVINATVTQELPPTYDFTVGSASGYELGEAVEHEILGGQGVITAINGSTLTVLATGLWDGFSASNKLVGPNASQTISGQVSASPAPTFLWDHQMQSQIHGYPGWGAKHKGRAYLCDFPGAPQAFAVSVAGFIDDFTMGELDGDGFVETLGANSGGDLKYIVSAEDLLFFTSRGLFYQQTRDGSSVTPRSIGPIQFSNLGCAGVTPIAVDDGAVFIDSVGSQVYAAVLAGDIYRSWTARNISRFHSHLITGPIVLGATASGSERPEQFIYLVNSDGSAAVAQWDRETNRVGWRPWTTDGSFKAIYQVFGRVHAVVERVINSVTVSFRERFVTGLVMDCVASLSISDAFPLGETGVDYFAGVTKVATHLDGHVAAVYFEGWDLEDRMINAAGAPIDENQQILDYPEFDGIAQIGLPFDIRLRPWPRRSVNTQRAIRRVKRHVKIAFTVQDTHAFTFDGQDFGGYGFGDDTDLPPALRSEEVSFVLVGRDDFEERELVVERPGLFRLLKIKYRVTV